MSIVEDTERTRFCPQTDRRTDGQGDTSIPPFQLRWSGGYNNISDGTKASHNESQQSISNNHDKMMHFIQYFPMIMHIIHALLCFGVFRCLPSLPIFVRLTSQALGQSYDCPSACEVNLMDIVKYITWIHYVMIIYPQQNQTQTNHVHISWDILYMVVIMSGIHLHTHLHILLSHWLW